MVSRREFLAKGTAGLAWLGLAGAAEVLGGWRSDARADVQRPDDLVVTILHTNDVHSRIDPFPADGGRYAGLGGAARRATLIRQIRAQNPHTLLVDAGDVFQGTPYFNLFRGRVDFEVMTALGYDAMTMGNHDFDGGMAGLLEVMPCAHFPLLNANYDFSASDLAGHVAPCAVRELGAVRVGIFGLGVALEGLVSPALRRGVVYGDPLPAAARMAQHLRADEKCDLVVCLSHLGNEGYQGQPGDQQIAAAVEGIDLIVGGHSHTFMEAPTRKRHGDRETLVFQVGWGGIQLGRVDFHLRAGKVRAARACAIPVGEPAQRAA